MNKLIPIGKYKAFRDGWSRDRLMGVKVWKGMIIDMRMGDLYEGDYFYDNDGSRFDATHVVVIGEKDITVSKTRIAMNMFRPSKEQLKALSKAAHMMPWDNELKTLLKGLKKC